MCTVRDDEMSLLESLVKESNALPGPIIEIGTLLGVSTTNMALWKSPDKKIITVDLFAWNPWGLTSEQHRDITTQMLHYLTRTKHVELVVSCKNAFYESYRGEPPALVFLDAIHDYPETAKDIAWAQSVGARIISGHDYSAEFPGVIEAVDEVGGPSRLEGTVWRL
jgi:predicted O-methyltransferase YrrM